jgi:hypothetical protein
VRVAGQARLQLAELIDHLLRRLALEVRVLIAAGVNAKALATFVGHAKIGITLGRYGHLMPGSEAEAAGLLDTYLDAQRERAAEAARAAGGALAGARAGARLAHEN